MYPTSAAPLLELDQVMSLRVTSVDTSRRTVSYWCRVRLLAERLSEEATPGV